MAINHSIPDAGITGRAQYGVIVIAAVLLLVSMAAIGSAQQAPAATASNAIASAATAGALANQAHGLAQDAQSLEELTQVLRVCGKALKANPSPETKTYVNQLASWTYNKRGEELVELAERTAGLDAERPVSPARGARF